MKSTSKLITTLGVVAFAAATSHAFADSTAKDKAAQFRATESAMQQESTGMPSASPPVSKTTPSADPVPKARTKKEKTARFKDEEKAMQDASTNMPPSAKTSNAPAADPIPKATTKAQKIRRFDAEERAMQQESTP